MVSRVTLPHLQKNLRWPDLLPVIGWLLLQGKCRYCQAAISARYPLVEFFSAFVALTLLFRQPVDGIFAASLLLFWMLLALSLIDIDHFLLPDVITLPLLWLGLVLKAGEGIPGSLHDAIFGAVIGYSALWLISHIYQSITGINGLGMGDAKLLAALGAWLGWPLLPYVLLIACGGAILALFIGKIAWQRDLDHPLAFGPWMALAGISLFINTII
nr:A24 family peptidase [Pantoea rodasii]